MDPTDPTDPTHPIDPTGPTGRGDALDTVGAATDDLIRRLAEAPWLDPAAGALGRVADRLLPPGRTRGRWQGDWLGHPLHPALTDLPIGMWTSALVLDLVGGRGGRRAADDLVALGLVTAVPTALAGAAEMAGAANRSVRRIAAAHAAGNAAGTALYALSWRARRRGNRARGVALSVAGASVLTVAGYLGGHLAYRRGMGVATRGTTRRPTGGGTGTESGGGDERGAG